MTSISSAPMTLADYGIISREPLVSKVIFSLVDNGSVMARDIPFFTKKQLAASGVRWEGNLPAPNWVALNTQPVSVTGTPKPYTEQAYILRNSIDIDKKLTEDENQIVDPRGTRVEAYLRGVAFDFNDKFINNDHVSGDANSIVGLKYRLNNTLGVRSEQLIDAGGVDLSLSGITAAHANQFLEYLDQALSYVDAPNGSSTVCIYMNEDMLRRFRTALRTLGTSGGLSVMQDQFDRTIETYKNCKLFDIGRKIDQTTKIITSTETSAGVAGSSNYTSIYVANYGADHLYGWQFDPLAARDIGELNDGVTLRTVVDWAGGLMNDNLRSFARIFDIKVS